MERERKLFKKDTKIFIRLYEKVTSASGVFLIFARVNAVFKSCIFQYNQYNGIVMTCFL